MKHLLYTLLGILLLAGCKEDKYYVIIPMSDIYLSAPQDGANIGERCQTDSLCYQRFQKAGED